MQKKSGVLSLIICLLALTKNPPRVGRALID